MSRMDKIITINGIIFIVLSKPLLILLSDDAEKDGDLVCQAGARWVDINDTLKAKGM